MIPFRSGLRSLLLGMTMSLLTVFNGCETDIDVTAPYEDITVIYGLLNQNDSLHYIKINKAFLGEASTSQMASVRDSSEYDNIFARIEEYNGANTLIKRYILRDTIMTNKDSGMFYAPKQKLYYFAEPDLNPKNHYKLVVEVPISEDSTKEVTAETELINDFGFSGDILSTPDNIGISFVDINVTGFQSFEVKWLTPKDGMIFELSARFNYTNVTMSDEMVEKSMEWNVKRLKADDPSGNNPKEMAVQVSGEQFYTLVEQNIPPISDLDNVYCRIPGTIEFFVTVGGEELNTYMEVNEPTTSIVQNKPDYTNVENGIGIFSGRYNIQIEKNLSKSTYKGLFNGVTFDGSNVDVGGRFCCNPMLPSTDPTKNSCNDTEPCKPKCNK